MRTWLIFCLFCANYVGCEMEFPPLPQGKPYSLESEEDSWSLNGLTSIANDIALTLRNQAPYGKDRLQLYCYRVCDYFDLFYPKIKPLFTQGTLN